MFFIPVGIFPIGVCVFKLLLPLAVFTTLISGCSFTPEYVEPIKPDPLQLKIYESVKAIQAKSVQLHAIESARHFELNGNNPQEHDLSLIPGLENIVSLGAPWHGPLDKFLIQLSAAAGMNAPRFLTVKPSGGVIVSVDTEYRRVIDMLSDASTQAASKASISIKMKERLFEVKYIGL